MLTRKPEEQPQRKEEQPPATLHPQPKVFYDRVEEVELDEDWEEKFRKHMEETKRLEREAEELKERKEKKESSWQLLKECTRYLKENEPKWKTEDDKYCKEAKNTRVLTRFNILVFIDNSITISNTVVVISSLMGRM